jgi:L-iditol 2-dehydrogenase
VIASSDQVSWEWKLFMRVAELVAPFEFRIAEMPIEDPGPGDVQVRVDSVGICGSDLHAWSEGSVGDSANRYPMVLGHEPAGTVVKTGAGVTGIAPGDRGALEPALYCYHCEYCQRGQFNVCANIRFLSNPGHPGFFRERVNLPASNFFPIPATLSADIATLGEPLAVALHSLKFAAVHADDTVAVFGAGPIGLLTIAGLKAAGVGRIWAVEPVAHRREMAIAIGAAVAVPPEEAIATILRDTGKRGVDCAIDCAAGEQTTNEAMRVSRNAGRVVLTGIHAGRFVPIEGSTMRRKELTIFNVRRSNDEAHAALDLLIAHPEWFAPLVTHVRGMEQVADAFTIAGKYLDGVGKMIVRPQQS